MKICLNLNRIKLDYLILLIGYLAQGLSYVSIIIVPSFFFTQAQIGVLGISLSIQFILAQIFGLGLHFSSLYYKSIAIDNSIDSYNSVSSNLTVSVVSVTLGIISYFLFPLFAIFYKQFDLDFLKIYLLFSAVFFSINKVMFSELNVEKKYSLIGKIYIFKSIISFLIILLVLFKKIKYDQYIIYQLLIPELLVYVYYLKRVVTDFFKTNKLLKISFVKRDLFFGIKSVWGTIFFEASTKIDILMLGVFVSPQNVGLYSLVSMISDLFLNIITVLRTLINPDIATEFMSNKSNFISFISKKINFCYKVLIPVLAIFSISFLIATRIIKDLYIYEEAAYVFIILALLLSTISGYLPLMLTFGQIGKPNLQSFNFFILFLSNLILNYFFIPLYGIYGSALATGLSYIFYVLSFKFLLFKTIKI